MKLYRTFVIILIVSISLVEAATTTSSPKAEFDTWSDIKESLDYAKRGSYLQFTTTQNLVFWGITVGSAAYYIHNDKRISGYAVNKHKNEGVFRLISDGSVIFNTPLLPAIIYYNAKSKNDEKMVRFTKEYLATLTLSLIEAAAISAVPVHKRPDEKDLSTVETVFRGQSSFPSGHVIGFAALGFKTLQFYGPLYASLPLALAAATAFERVHSEKHYASDVIASGFITLMASEGVRMASNYEHNHPIYKLIFERELKVGLIKTTDGGSGVKVAWNY